MFATKVTRIGNQRVSYGGGVRYYFTGRRSRLGPAAHLYPLISRMIRARGCVVGALALAAFAPLARTEAGTGAPDFQQWTELDALIGVASRTSVTIIGQARFSETLANPVFTGSGLDLSYQYDAWTFAMGYRHQITGYHTDEPQVTQLALLMTTYAHRIGRSTVSVRGRIENTISAFSNPWRVRLRGEYRWATPDCGPLTWGTERQGGDRDNDLRVS